jgi:cytochrome c553
VNRILRLITTLTAALLLAAGPVPAAAQAASEDATTSVSEHMHEQLTLISTIKSLIIAGKLEQLREPATLLADHETVAGLPDNFGPFLARLRTYARHVIEADDLVFAAKSVSKMAQTCGACHAANDVMLEFGYDRPPRLDVEDIVTHMQRHQWAVDRLWEGLIGPSAKAWNRGADMLIDVPLDVDVVTTTTALYREISEIMRRIHSLGRLGTETSTPDERGDLYGEVLGLCASCHVLLGRGPGN